MAGEESASCQGNGRKPGRRCYQSFRAGQAIRFEIPAGSAIVKKHGFATREYLLALYAYIQSVTVVSMKKSGQLNDPSKVEGVVNPANLDLVEKNWDEIQKLNDSFNGGSDK